uniref:Cyclin I n=1 Tax=Mustela putorius furo TaxID=9669 RepID=M3XT94_MUSPF
MERIILDKLNWDLHTATPLDFLHIFHAIAVSTRPQLLFSLPRLSPSQHLAVLTKQLLHCMACNQLLQFKGSMLALAMVSLEMEKLIPDWLPLTIELLQKAQVGVSQSKCSLWLGYVRLLDGYKAKRHVSSHNGRPL